MPKYRVRLGSLVTKLMSRTFTVSAPDEQTAIERAQSRFIYACNNATVYTDCGGSIEVDGVEIVEERQ